MNIRRIPLQRSVLAALLACAMPAWAAPPPPAGILVDCADPALPSQRQVSDLIGSNNGYQTYAARQRLMLQARRACHRGVSSVRLVRAVDEQAPAAAPAPLAAQR